jgi:hypothetical protein
LSLAPISILPILKAAFVVPVTAAVAELDGDIAIPDMVEVGVVIGIDMPFIEDIDSRRSRPQRNALDRICSYCFLANGVVSARPLFQVPASFSTVQRSFDLLIRK